MRYLLALFIFFTASAHAQVSDKEIQDNIKKMDTMNAQLNESIKRNMHVMDSMEMVRSNEQMARNMDSFMADRREQEKKKMQGIYWRLAFGGLMLVVFIVGMVRKKKKEGHK